jgi:hypothetical protein
MPRWSGTDKQGVTTEIDTEIILERDGGVESEKAYNVSGGQKTLVRHRRLISISL